MDLEGLEKELNYIFQNRALLETAIQHSSFVNESLPTGMEDNERFEFLGDAILNAVISHLLMTRYPELNEGELSKIRSHLVNRSQLAKIAKKISLGNYLRLGKGELQSSGQKKISILADAFEAIIAAVYLDSDFNRAYSLIDHLFLDVFNSISTAAIYFDYKSRLQEFAQATLKSQPEYIIISETGPDHDKTFEVALSVGDIRTTGKGKSKKAAEQEAARIALELQGNQDSL